MSAHGQAAPAAKLPAFDVVSVKANKSGTVNSTRNYSPGGITAINVTLPMLIEVAYGIRSNLFSGAPGWMETEHFDLNAKMVDQDPDIVKKLSFQDRSTMLRPVLEERFHLKVHTETRTLPVYELVVARGGPKLTETKEPNVPFHDRSAGSWGIRNTELSGHDVALSTLVFFLESQTHRTVLDKTGLTGHYDLLLTWSSDDASPDSSVPSVLTAIQEQLGLKLVSSKGPVETLVIDHVDPPSEN